VYVAASRLAVVNMLSTTLPAPHRAEVSIDAHRDSLATQGGEKYGLAISSSHCQHDRQVDCLRPHAQVVGFRFAEGAVMG
jgi:hypothetical protein